MSRVVVLVLIFLTAVASCSTGPSDSDIQTAIAETSQAQPAPTKTKIVRTATPSSTPLPTDTPLPTATLVPTETSIPTPTKVPLSDLDLESILYLSGDLPSYIVPGQISTDIGMTRYSLGSPTNRIALDLNTVDITMPSRVTIVVYETAEAAISLYAQLAKDTENMLGYDDDFTMAEQGIAGHDGTGTSVTNLLYGRNEKGTIIQRTVFLRCNSVTSVSLIVDSPDDTAKKYAQRLDDRLVDLVCPNISREEN